MCIYVLESGKNWMEKMDCNYTELSNDFTTLRQGLLFTHSKINGFWGHTHTHSSNIFQMGRNPLTQTS